jgi:peptidoglycan/LPS O-acetylase OafA/YrhL
MSFKLCMIIIKNCTHLNKWFVDLKLANVSNLNSNTASGKKNAHIFFSNLDGLRFFVFLSVFLAHSFYLIDSIIFQNKFCIFVKPLINRGVLGVNFFFVLSGFLITYLLYGENSKTGTINLKNFYLRRILRIWPLFFNYFFWLYSSSFNQTILAKAILTKE